MQSRLLGSASLIAFLVIAASPVDAQNGERIEIDGKKNPELIPDYMAWRQALRIISSETRDRLPTGIYRTATEADARLMIDAGLHLNKVEQECTTRLLKAREPLQHLELAGASADKRVAVALDVDPVMWAIELECREETLKMRDRVLEKLTPVAASELRNVVELIRSGMSVSVAKNGLERFRQPASQGQPAWSKSVSRHFEIHYLPALAPELARVTLSAERAYDRISTRLNFYFATKVPLVMFSPSGTMTQEQVVAFAVSDRVAPQHPHRARIVLPLREDDAQLDTLILHELTHLLVGEIILPSQPGNGGVPSWVHEGIASYLSNGWSDEHERLMRELAANDRIPTLSQLSGDGGLSNPRVNDAIGHVAFDYIESRWGQRGIRRFINALIVLRVDKTYDAVFELTPTEFDAAFRQYAERRFRPVIR